LCDLFIQDKGKLVVRRGRKAMGPPKSTGLFGGLPGRPIGEAAFKASVEQEVIRAPPGPLPQPTLASRQTGLLLLRYSRLCFPSDILRLDHHQSRT
jgi:hypothetical protein